MKTILLIFSILLVSCNDVPTSENRIELKPQFGDGSDVVIVKGIKPGSPRPTDDPSFRLINNSSYTVVYECEDNVESVGTSIRIRIKPKESCEIGALYSPRITMYGNNDIYVKYHGVQGDMLMDALMHVYEILDRDDSN